MSEAKLVGMKHEASLRFGMVERIALNRVTVITEVDTDLMGSSCIELTVNKACFAESL